MTSKLSNTAFFTNKEEILPPPLLQWAFARVTADMIEFGSYLLSPRVKREKNGIRLSLLWTDPVLCVSALAEHMLYYKTYQPVWGKASLCVPSLLSHRTTSGFSPSSVPRPLVKKNAENSQKALEASYVWRHLNPCLAHTGVLAFPLHRLFSNSRDAQTFPLRYFWTLCRF